MNGKRKRRGDIDRREFMTGAGTFLGAAIVTSSLPGAAKVSKVPAAGVIKHDPERCVGCGVCSMMCSLSHEGAVGPVLSRPCL